MMCGQNQENKMREMIIGHLSSSSFAIPSVKEETSSEIAMTSPQNGKKRARSPTPTKGRTAAVRPPARGQEGGSPPPLYRHARAKGGRTDGRTASEAVARKWRLLLRGERRTRRTDGPASVEERTEEGQQQCRCAF